MVTIQQAMSTFKSVLDESGLRYELIPNERIIVIHMSLPNRLRNTTMILGFDQSGNNPDACIRVVSMALADISVDNSSVAQMCEYLTRINDTIIIGGMEMNVDNRNNIRYRISAELSDHMLDDAIVRRMIVLPLQIMEQYGDGLLAISMGLLSAKEAYRQAQNRQSQQ